MRDFRTDAAIRRIIVSTLMFAPFHLYVRTRLGMEGLWNGYTPYVLLAIGGFEVVMLGGQVSNCISGLGLGENLEDVH